MTVADQQPELPAATVKRRRRIPLVWIVPLLTGLIAAWLAWDTFSKRGPTITVTFDTAAGLTAGQSQLKYRNVVMGTVSGIAVAPDLENVVVRIDTTREAEPLLKDTTEFWVVKPQLFAGSFSGLDTLFSGSYIALRPKSDGSGKAKRHFIGQEQPPILQAGAKGTTFKLETKRLGSISIGSPIFFRDIEVGTVLGWDLGDLAEKVTVHAFVHSPFDQYVRQDSLFWNASGVSVKLGDGGVSVQMESLRALLLGGIAFDTPRDSKQPAATQDETFNLYTSFDAAKTAGFSRRLQLLSYFPGSVAGLSAGAEVTLYGLRIGEVTEVSLMYDKETDRIVAPVHYQVDAERVTGIAAAQGLPPGFVAAEMVRRGLRATLQAPSLISPGKIIALEMVPDAEPATLRREGDLYVVPTSQTGGFDSLTRSASELMAKLNRIDFDKIGKSLAGAAAGLDDTLNGPQLKATLASLQKALGDVQDFMHKLDTEGAPALKRLPAIAAQLQAALTSANKMMLSFNAGYGDDSRFRRDVDRMLPQVTDMVRSLKALTDLLSRHPEALIRGRTNSGTE
ncbi:MAG: MCE family protein [Alphaproteobacteria bacterium]|nr:MCE family protein [Alphaproteobacteria bacterium]MBV8407624.1 MCE family protein [Alphaproteobacteria bacterium]